MHKGLRGLRNNKVKIMEKILNNGKTIEDLIDRLLLEDKGSTFTGNQLKEKYGIDKGIQRVITSVKVLGSGKSNVEWNNKWLINSMDKIVIKVKDGIVDVRKNIYGNIKGYTISGGLYGKLDNKIYDNVFLNNSVVAMINKDG